MRIPLHILAPLRLIAGAFFLLGIAVPMATLAGRMISSPASWSLLLDEVTLAILRVTVIQASLSTALSLAIGIPLGMLARGSRAANALLGLPFGVPTVVVAGAMVALLGGGRTDWLYSLKAVVLAHVLLNAPWVGLLVSQAAEQSPVSLVEAARMLGAGRSARFRFVHWPFLRPTVVAAAAQVFALCSMSFAIVLILGGGPPVQTLETAIYSRLRLGMTDFPAAVAMAMWQLVLTVIPWAIALRSRPIRASLPDTRSRAGTAPGAAIAVAMIFVIPYFLSLADADFARLDRDAWRQLGLAALVSLKLALSVAAATVVLAAAALAATQTLGKTRALAQGALAIPAGVSALVLGLGFWLAYSTFVDPFEGSFLLIAGLQVALFFPLAFRMLWPLAQRADSLRLEAALTLGASPIAAFRTVEWPRWRGPVLALGAMIAALSLGEVAAVSLFYSENLVPLPLLMTRWLGQYRFEEAQAVGCILLLACSGLMGEAMRRA